LGRSRGGFGTKVHVRAEGQGKPLIFMLTGGERHEQTVFESLMEGSAVRRAGRGRPYMRPERLVGDKGYSTEKVRGYLRRRGIGVLIPHRKNRQTVYSTDASTENGTGSNASSTASSSSDASPPATKREPPTTWRCSRWPPSCSGFEVGETGLAAVPR
jgi:hypothetical protein